MKSNKKILLGSALICIVILAFSFVVGRDIGFTIGHTKGYNTGYDGGYDNGLNTGWEQGLVQGREQGLVQGWEYGYDNGIKIGRQGYNRWDPTHDEMSVFLMRDETNKNEYVDDEYTCWNFAADVCKNAGKENIRCALVYIAFTNYTSHAIVAFDTIDFGLVFIEPQTDDAVEVRVGLTYQVSHKYSPSGIVESYAIIW